MKCLVWTAFQVEDTVLVLFTKKMFRWNTTDFLYFRLSVFVFINVGQFLAFPFLKKVPS
jgi:hypothetical protein